MRICVRVLRREAPVLLGLAALALACPTAAEEAPSPLLSAPTTYTDVADAFEEGNPIDVNVRLGYRHDVTYGTIQRELVDASSEDGRSSRHRVNIADYTRVQNE